MQYPYHLLPRPCSDRFATPEEAAGLASVFVKNMSDEEALAIVEAQEQQLHTPMLEHHAIRRSRAATKDMLLPWHK